MSGFPRISIVTPSYNQGRFLEETICSVLDQDYPNLEYIVIDGGSKDQSVEIIQKYASRLAYWVSEKDGGQPQAINKGFAHCTGDILAWINSDDLYIPGVFNAVSEFFVSNPEIDLIYGDAEIVDVDGNFIMHRKELSTDRVMGNLIGWGLLVPQPAAFWRRRVIEIVGYLDESFRYALDADYWFRVSQKCQIRHISQLYARQRYHDQAKTIVGFPTDPKYPIEIDSLLHRSYQELGISKIIPYRYAWLPRRFYRMKRILLRLVLGHYFTGYIPDWINRKKVFRK